MKRLVIVADNSLIVDAIALGLRKSGEFDVLDHIDSGTASAAAIACSQPDVVLVDDMGQSRRVVELVAQLHDRLDRVAVIVLTLAIESPWLDEVFDAGATGAISKAIHPGALTTLLRETINGNVVHVSKRAAKNRGIRPHVVAANGSALTPRELEVLRLVASGSSNGEIAQALWVTEQTVKFHLSNVYKKLDVANRTEASHYALVHGLVSARKPVESA